MEDRWSTLDQETREKAEHWVRLLERLGFRHPQRLVQRDLDGERPEVARLLLFRRLWRDAIDVYQNSLSWIERQIEEGQSRPGAPFADAGLALRRMTEAGVSPNDIASVARMAAFEAVFQVLYLIEFGRDTELAYEPQWERWLPRWALVEMDPESNEWTGRRVDGLHEDILMADPSGRDGKPAKRTD